jgi:ABC-2 type transport system permease protein
VIRLIWLDYMALLRARRTWLVGALMASAVLAVPLLLSRPPSYVLGGLTSWFGSSDRFTLFLYLWTDLAMNKLIAITAVVLAGATLVAQRDAGILPILASKPIPLSRLFLAQALAACAALGTVYIAGHLLGLAYFARTVEGFRPGVFLVSMALHVHVAFFSVALSATIAVFVARRTLGVLVSLLTLFMLLGSSFIGFYNPAWKSASLVNPYALGVQALAHLPSPRLADLVGPMLGLIAGSSAILALGAARSSRWTV